MKRFFTLFAGFVGTVCALHAQDYPHGDIVPLPDGHVTVTKIICGDTSIAVADDGMSYQSLLPKSLRVARGETLNVSLAASDSTAFSVQIDFSQNGQFEADETFSNSISIDENLPEAFYRMRVTVGQKAMDCLLNVHAVEGQLSISGLHGYILGGTTGVALPNTVTVGVRQSFGFVPVSSGYTTTGAVFKHGHGLDGEQYIHGNRQWSEYAIKFDTKKFFTLSKDSIDGDMHVTCEWQRTSDDAMVCVFSDEFNGQGEPSAGKWMRTPRSHATWNRFCSDSPLVVYEENGNLVCRAIPNPDRSQDDVDMLTGGIQSKGFFGFQYGRAEARIKTHQHTGNFPAFWMMPVDNSKGWPNAGEIDIWETIDEENSSWHTVHSNWTYNLKHTNEPKSSIRVNNVDMNLWHTYSVIWDANCITWQVDGRDVGSYVKSTDDSILEQGQWPFDHPFYLILNQSVGNNAWAKDADITHTYETLFDWVRVYQPVELTNIDNVTTTTKTDVIYDLNGRKITRPTKAGIYIRNGKKFIIQ